MKITRVFPVFLILLLGTLISACGAVSMNANWPGASAGKDLIYAANGPQVYAIKLVGNALDATPAWKFPEKADPAKPFYATPVLLSNGLLLVGDYGNNGTLYALDAATGASKWMFTQAKGRWVAPPLVDNETIYAASADGSLYVLDLQGALKWKYDTRASLWSQPVIDAQNVYFTSMDHFLYAVNKSGRKVWSTDLGASAIGSPAMAKDGTLYVGTLGNELLAVQPANGKIIWRKALKGSSWGAPVYDNGLLYVGDLAGNLYAIAADTGNINWTYPAGSAITGSPVVLADSLAVVTEKGALSFVTLDGKTKTVVTKPETGRFFGTPTAAGNGLLLVSAIESDFFLYAYDSTGAQVGSFKAPK